MRKTILCVLLSLSIWAANGQKDPSEGIPPSLPNEANHKMVIYQVFTRLFGNQKTLNKPWGTIEENGVGKFADFTPKAIREIKALGATHIWFTGVLHHDVIRDYKAFGISEDDPDVVKGRAGSPYAIKDYYNVDPDLAVDPTKRLDEFRAIIKRVHAQGLKVLIDIVPNHVARNYHSIFNPPGEKDFGAEDDKKVVYSKNNSFYYLPGDSFKVPAFPPDARPLGGEKHPLADGKFSEFPAKWTGNGSRLAQPRIDDWYETVKINYGVSPEGHKDFETLPEGFDRKSWEQHYSFWSGKDVPLTWKKFRAIALYWMHEGVDGFRFDMAEMVPVEFWSYLNSTLKHANPSVTLVAEVYNPDLYRSYIRLGKMDYLYDKVAFYDSLKHIMQGKAPAIRLVKVQTDLADIEHHMLHFLENHDENRIASPDFTGNAQKGKPALVVSATISTAPMLIYFGQEVGEKGAEMAGFGKPGRTSIFDYIGVPAHQRWMNGGAFDGGKLNVEEKALREFYKKVLNFTRSSPALMGSYLELQHVNLNLSARYPATQFTFARWCKGQHLLITASFDPEKDHDFVLTLPTVLVDAWKLKDGSYSLIDQLNGDQTQTLNVSHGIGSVHLTVKPLESLILSLK
ncbi:MAG: alpha-amylase family protein [Marinilabiliales bacterium]|nr:alpha-amylase family protein [Marinilabiliales bacterium]